MLHSSCKVSSVNTHTLFTLLQEIVIKSSKFLYKFYYFQSHTFFRHPFITLICITLVRVGQCDQDLSFIWYLSSLINSFEILKISFSPLTNNQTVPNECSAEAVDWYRSLSAFLKKCFTLLDMNNFVSHYSLYISLVYSWKVIGYI